jgi:integrase
MPQDRKHLQKRGEIWYARVIVPPSLTDKLGTHLRKSLKTSSLTEANQRKYAVIAELKRQIAQAKHGASYKDWQEALRQAPNQDARDEIELLVTEAAEEMEAKVGHQQALAWFRKATQTDEALSELIETFLGLKEHSTDTLRKHQKALAELRDHFLEDDLPPKALDRRKLLEFVDNLLDGELAPNTKRDRLGSLGGFWGWLEKRLHVPRGDNPFRGFTVKGGSTESSRGWTPEEVSLVLRSEFPHPWQRHALVMLLLTGARPSEILGLRHEDIDTKAQTLTITTSKTEAGTRTLPYRHPMLIEAVNAIWLGDKEELKNRVFPDAGPEEYPAKNYINWFSRHRKRIGLPEGTSLYSARKTFMGKVQDLKLDLINCERYFGHKIPRLALSVYSKGRSIDGLIEVAQGVADGWTL